ncbi:MAG: outer membrane transport energization protein TonB [Bacteroidetes bacterium]|nr:MAG: outer membrane transport energization protein TonB [Bacteroidota bacterium]
MKKIFVFSILFIHVFWGYAQVLPEKILMKKNYLEVKLFDAENGFSLIEKFAMYPDGKEGIIQHIVNTLKYPRKAQEKKIEGEVIVQYTVDIDGSITNVKVTQSVHDLLDNEAIRVIKQMEKWEPAYQRGKPVKSLYTQLFRFKL